MPKGGFGNLIALPLQKRARAHNCSVFVDDSLQPYPDQWAFLASLQRISLTRAEAIVRDAEQKGKIIGVCFQSAFMKQKWDEIINFDYIINSDISVEVMEV